MALTLAPADLERAEAMVGAALLEAQKANHQPMRAALAFRAMVEARPDLAEAVVVTTASALLPQVRKVARQRVSRGG